MASTSEITIMMHSKHVGMFIAGCVVGYLLASFIGTPGSPLHSNTSAESGITASQVQVADNVANAMMNSAANAMWDSLAPVQVAAARALKMDSEALVQVAAAKVMLDSALPVVRDSAAQVQGAQAASKDQSSSETDRAKRMMTRYGISCTNYLPGSNEEEVQQQYTRLLGEFVSAYDRSAETLIKNHPVEPYVACFSLLSSGLSLLFIAFRISSALLALFLRFLPSLPILRAERDQRYR